MGALALFAAASASPAFAAPSFAISFPAARSAAPLDGRIVLMLATDKTKEPRQQIESDQLLKSPWLFGLTVDGLKPGQDAVIDASTFGWPVRSLAGLKPGSYVVQAVLNRYETFHRGDGVTVKLPPDKGEGQNWTIKPGNLYSRPVTVHVDPNGNARVRIVLDREMPAIAPKADTPFV